MDDAVAKCVATFGAGRFNANPFYFILFFPFALLIILNTTLLEKILSFENSRAYIKNAISSFDYSFYYVKFCKGLKRPQVSAKFKKDLENPLFDFDVSETPSTIELIQDELDHGLPVLLN